MMSHLSSDIYIGLRGGGDGIATTIVLRSTNFNGLETAGEVSLTESDITRLLFYLKDIGAIPYGLTLRFDEDAPKPKTETKPRKKSRQRGRSAT
jgi:hypothetical protein